MSSDEIERVIRILRKSDPSSLTELLNSPALTGLETDARVSIAGELAESSIERDIAFRILQAAMGDDNAVEELDTIRDEMVMCLIALGQFQAAVQLVGERRAAPEQLSIAAAFNYAMAEWGLYGRPPRDLCERVVQLDEERKNAQAGANYEQCLAMALQILGRGPAAMERLSQAESVMEELADAEFSCWRYLRVRPREFLQDCAEMRAMMRGSAASPRFLVKALFSE